MIEICPKDFCTGCQACRLVCPTKAIIFEEDEKGNIYPQINQNLCIDCLKCERICPSNHPVPYNPLPKGAIACWVKDNTARLNSTSGGLSYGISKAFVENGGYFAGVTWSAQINNAIHSLTNKINELTQYQGSKYSHSEVGNIYEEIKIILERGEKVLFAGTPCQVAGLKAYLKKDYSELFTVGLVCHGVPSRKVLRERIETLEKEYGKKIIDYKSRVKTPNQYLTSSQYTFQDGKSLRISVYKDFFFRFFVSNYGIRPNCFNCQYARSERVEDITVADFWGYSPNSLKFRSYKKGTSEVLINNGKGKMLFDLIKKDLVIDYRTLTEAQSCNRNLVAPQEKPKYYEEFWIKYLAGESKQYLYNKYFPPTNYKISMKSKIKTFIKMILPKELIKKLKR